MSEKLLAWVDAYIHQHLGGPGSGYHGHKGRPGQEGGSGPGGGGGTSTAKPTTSKKVANSLSKAFRIRMSSGAAFGGGGDRNTFSGHTSLKKQAAIEKSLVNAGFHKFKNPYRQDFVTSYTNGSIGVDLSESDTVDGMMLYVSVYPYTGKSGPLPHIPYD